MALPDRFRNRETSTRDPVTDLERALRRILPGAVDEDGVEASLEEGVLTVRVPKAQGEQARRIEIR